MRSLLVVHNHPTAAERLESVVSKQQLPESVMRAAGYTVATARGEEQARQRIAEADALILDLPIPEIEAWSRSVLEWKVVPILWWCSEATATLSVEACEDGVMADGVLSASMLPTEIHWTLQFGAKQCFERQQWHLERRQLLAKIEERKWIDMAKGILCEVKNITETEAYDILRKQAMNERKRLVDVAASIVNVYNLLQEQKQGRTKR
ncbi:ANTAR domain-containing protein [Cohnella ginsengisoli]|uniref:ANTAR domain-containing protein n=1 Tax=Cohnella ginsengisoli TaxID=425004 RepID=A0A9X4KKE6_9BACL|nr:ANTAR domain-containing protein [Cohnella ginsengisoli]MDG0791385.1 ANTAR domain-containing protein [Cohnella ginsengisoli]